MSRRLRIGCVHATGIPGTWSFSFMDEINSSCVEARISGQIGRKTGRVQRGHPEYQRRGNAFGHFSRGFRTIVVSNISTGAGSVENSNLPALPRTDSASGKVMM